MLVQALYLHATERHYGIVPRSELPAARWSMKPRLLDVFCGAGGTTRGFQRAGFYVVGVDKEAQPNYCGDEFIQGDALEELHRLTTMDFHRSFDGIVAGPPCQAYSSLRGFTTTEYPMLIAPVRDLLDTIGAT